MITDAEPDTVEVCGAVSRRTRMTRARALVAGAIVAGTMGVVAAPSAHAGEVYYHGSPTNNVLWPPCLSANCEVAAMDLGQFLVESSARTVNGNTVCAATFDTSVVCSGDLALKPLNGASIRRAFSRGTVDNPRPQGRARGAF